MIEKGQGGMCMRGIYPQDGELGIIKKGQWGDPYGDGTILYS